MTTELHRAARPLANRSHVVQQKRITIDGHRRTMKMQQAPMKTRLIFQAVIACLAATSTGLSQPVTFTQITTGDIVNDSGWFIFAAWGDFKNDGFLDLCVANWNNQTNVFYQNNGDGTFTKITGRNPVLDADNHVGVAVGDYDNDGNLDMIIGVQNRIAAGDFG